MTNHIADISQGQAARIAGVGYLIITILGILVYFFVLGSLLAPGDATATANNISANQLLFRLGIAGFLIMLICDVIVGWALYIFLKPVNQSIALLAVLLRLVYSTIHGAALLNLIFVVQLLNGADYLMAFEPNQLHALVLQFLNGHNFGFLIGLVFFGVHLSVLGYLILQSSFVPRILGVLLIIASIGYLIDSFANFLLANYADYETIFQVVVAAPAIIAELSLTLWLLIKGRNVQVTVSR